jgi:hypothetical protein
MKKTLAVAVLLTALFAAQNANGSAPIKQTDEESTSVSVQTENVEPSITDEHLVSTEMPVEIISANEEISSTGEQCNYGVGRYSGNVSIHYFNTCNYNIKIGYQYKFKRCCPTCDCSWSAVTTEYATLSPNISRRGYRTLKQGANQTFTYSLVDYWKR